MSEITGAAVSIILAIIGVAVIAVLVSKNSNTSGVLSSAGSSGSAFLGTALSPVTGSGVGLPSFSFTGGGAA